MPEKIIERRCAICGKTLKIKVYPDGRYEGGHYFGKIPVPKGKNYEYIEYWECDKCFSEG